MILIDASKKDNETVVHVLGFFRIEPGTLAHVTLDNQNHGKRPDRERLVVCLLPCEHDLDALGGAGYLGYDFALVIAHDDGRATQGPVDDTGVVVTSLVAMFSIMKCYVARRSEGRSIKRGLSAR